MLLGEVRDGYLASGARRREMPSGLIRPASPWSVKSSISKRLSCQVEPLTHPIAQLLALVGPDVGKARSARLYADGARVRRRRNPWEGDRHRAVAASETYERPAIAGSGTIACGLAACASVVSKTVLLARSDASAWKAEEQAHALCAKVEGADAKRVKVTTRPADLASCDVVVEAVVEELEPKVELLRTVGEAAPDADLASTTSSLSLDELGSGERTRRSASSACIPSTPWSGWS